VPIRKRVKAALGAAASLAGLYELSFRSKMLIVAFHRVNDNLREDALTCSSAKFAAFCRFFRSYFDVVPLSHQISELRAGKRVAGTLSITFDDGYLDNFEVAAPILRALDLHATFFVTTGFIDSKVIPFWDRELDVQPGWMTWENVRALKKQGFDIGCHTRSHIDMGTADAATVRVELDESIETLRRELGTRPP